MATDDTAKTMEARLTDLGASLGRILDSADHSQLAIALKKELAIWREWLDEARVQSALASMELRGRAAEITRKVERTYAQLLKRVRELEELPEPVPGLSESVRRELEQAKDELASPQVYAS